MSNAFQKLIHFLADRNYRFICLSARNFYDKMPDEAYLKQKYRAVMGAELNLAEPRTISEKMQWLKLYNRKPEYTMMVDKYQVRDYIAQTLGEQYLIPLLGVWDDPDDIDFDTLPDRFVLKCNHNSGLGMCICKDKSQLDIANVKAALRKGLNQDYYLTEREWPYKDVPRKIIGEMFMEEADGSDLADYKVMCFGGEPKLIQIHQGRFGAKHTQDFYDTDWNKTTYEEAGYPLSDHLVPKPQCLEDMLRFSQLLATGIPLLRVDWYCINGHLYFGELTFFDSAGYCGFNEKDSLELGSWIPVPPSM